MHVTVKLLGGLGNQMFQYAIARALADRSHCGVRLNLSDFENYSLRRYELDAYAIRAEVVTQRQNISCEVKLQAFVKTVLSKFGINLKEGRERLYSERSFVFDPSSRDWKPPANLEGYWQSEKYFIEIAESLRQDFSLRERPDSANEDVAARISCANAVSLHVRRGDYVTNAHTASYHGICSLEYYAAAIDFVAGRVADPHFFVFSDDLPWAYENLRLAYPSTLVDCNGPDKGVWDMALMKQCKHHIIANSSFSWWGAWLNPNPNKVVVAPLKWFNKPEIDTSDLIPESWIRI
jgi:Glycosyl transferase family 11